MPEITVLFDTKEEPSKEKVDEELNWYDIIKQEMMVFQGGKLTFRYKEDDYLVRMGTEERQRRGIKSTYRVLPEVEDIIVDNHFKMVQSTNQKEIEKWFNNVASIDDVSMEEVSGDGMIFEVPEKEKDDFCYQLERYGFRFRI